MLRSEGNNGDYVQWKIRSIEAIDFVLKRATSYGFLSSAFDYHAHIVEIYEIEICLSGKRRTQQHFGYGYGNLEITDGILF